MNRVSVISLIFFLSLLSHYSVIAEPLQAPGRVASLERPLVVASSNNFPPLNILQHGQLDGFGRDISDAVLQAMDIKAERIHSPRWTEVLDWLDSGRADLIHDTGFTPERDAYLDFSQPIITMDEVIFVRNEQLDIHDLKSLAGKKVACVRNHITHIYLQQFDWINCHVVATPIEGVYALLSGRVDAYIYPREIVLYHLQDLGGSKDVKITGEVLRQLSWSMTVKEGNGELLQLLNQGIKQIKESGEYDRIYAKWFGESLYVGYTGKEVWGITLGSVVSMLMLFLLIGLSFHNRRLNRTNDKLASTLDELNSTQSALSASEKRLSSILNNSPAVIYVKDTAGRFVFINHQFEKIFELSSEMVLGKLTHDVFPQAIADQHRQNDLAVLKSCQALEYEEIAPINGVNHTYLSSKFCLFNEKSEPYGICGISTDITKRKRAEEMLSDYRENLEQTITERSQELNNTNELLHAVLDTIPSRVFWKDRESSFLGCNKAFLNDAGLGSEKELIGKNDFSFSWADRAEEYRKDDTQVMDAGESRIAYEEAQTTPDGGTIWLETSKIPLRHADGVVYGVLGTYQDITERKEFEAKLILAKEEAEAANHAKSAFLANMSHELRTPLHGILSYAQLGTQKKGGLSEDKINKYFSQISASGERLKVLLDDLLDLSKLEAGKMVMEMSLNDIPSIVDTCTGEQSALTDSRRLSIKTQLDPELPAVECDKNRIGQVIMNLLSNAIKFSPDGGQIVISAQPEQSIIDESEAVDVVHICLSDQGPGIPKGEEEEIFKKFIQSSYTELASGGTGLGLAITQELIHAHHGNIWCENSASGGAAFHFMIPIKAVENTEND